MENDINIYSKLRPWTEIESCECSEIQGLLLVNMLSENPIHCIECRKEIDPEKIQLTRSEVDQIARWLCIEQSVYNLWLDSGEFEQWAKEKLLDQHGSVVQRGLKAAEMLSKRYPTYYWHFRDTDDGEPTDCPHCGKKLDFNVKHGTGQCEQCRIRI